MTVRMFAESGPWRKADRIRKSICVICGVVEPRALETCPLSSAACTHLLASREGKS